MAQLEVVLFWLAIAGYSVGTVAYLTFLAAKKPKAGQIGLIALIIGWVLHLGAILTRWVEIRHVPLATQFEFLSFFAWTTVAIYLFTEAQTKQKIIGAFAVPIIWILMGASWISYITGGAEGSPLPTAMQESPWLVVHVTVAVISFASFALAFAVALIYLMQERHLKKKSTSSFFKRFPPLGTLDNLSYRAVVLGFALLTVTLVTGMIWAESTVGKFWVWDPKLTAAAATWIIFGAYLHARLTAGWQGRRSALIATIGFAAVLLTFAVSYFTGAHIETFLPGG